MAEALRAAGQHIEIHHDHFGQDTKDSEWLALVGSKGWVVLTKDRHIRSNQVEIESIITANIACFNLVSADMNGSQMAQAFVASLKDIRRMLGRIDRPLIANVTRSGGVDLLYRYPDLVKRLR